MSDRTSACAVLIVGFLFASVSGVAADELHELTFERDVRPVLLAKCGKCHGETAREANLDLRSMAAIRRGGDSGPAVDAKDGPKSLLLDRITSGEMPPKDEPQLAMDEIAVIRRWLRTGARTDGTAPVTDAWVRRLEEGRRYWAFQPPRRPPVPSAPDRVSPLADRPAIAPNDETIGDRLQAWYRADGLDVGDGERLEWWRDESGHERHLRPTWGRVDSRVGAPPQFARRSTINGRPAVRFDDIAGLGSLADNPVAIEGDGGWTTVVVANVRPPSPGSHTSVVVGFGDPAPGHNPRRPWASLIEVRRDAALLSHSGGYGHDARMPAQTMWPLYERPVVITIVKRPGPMAATTSIFLTGQPVDANEITGVETSSAIRHRTDFGLYMGRAHGSLGALRGDVAEVAIFNVALDDGARESLEAGLIRKYRVNNVGDDDANPIDAFIDARLEEQGLPAAPLADRRTLVRRAYFDLIGLPPSPEEVEAFVNDKEPRAWERVIERLLHSPHYGERWGRHWLDVARYADTGGYETDVYYRNAWRYRDYIVTSFNDDKPYDRFVREQIAGDEIWPDNLDLDGSYVMDPEKKRHFEALTGTGFYALGPMIHESNMDAGKLANERLTDWVDTTAAAFLGLTFGCARCHDHKFDPVSQRDYYALQAAFAGSREVEVPIQHGMGLADWKQHYPKVIALEEARMEYRNYERRTGGRERTEAEQARLRELKTAIADRLLAIPEQDAQSEAYAGVYERPTVTVLGHHRPELAPPVHLLSRGELTRPKQRMEPRLPGLLAETTGTNRKLTPGPSGSRRDLAVWLTRPDHPLTARVMVNRIWQWHFGRGIVGTPNDFGRMGVPPTHPELLDWLAVEFVDRGWSVKSMHRLIMTSRAYRRSSSFFTAEHGRVDPDNTLLWRTNRRRLEGEALWDAIHSVAGTINLTIGGRPVMPPLLAEELTNKSFWVESKLPSQHTRRGLYVIVRRNFNFPLFDLFDAPVNAVSCSGRDISTVAPQALWLLNNHASYGQAKRFAERLVREAGPERDKQVRRAWNLAFGRPATDDEVAEAIELIGQLREGDDESAALTKFCLTLFNLNEFVYVD